MKKLYLFFLVVVVFSLNSCEKDDAETQEAAKMKLIERLEELDVPEVMRNSSNENALKAVDCVDEIKGIADYFTWFDMPDDAIVEKSAMVSGGDTYYWSYGGYSIWETFTETSSEYQWQIDVDFGTGRVKYISSEEKVDGSEGFMTIYDMTEAANSVYTYEWTFDSDDNATVTWAGFSDSFKYEIKSNTDLSGSSKWWMGGILFEDFAWNSDGSGSYSYYGFDGSEYLSGSWAVADL